MLENRRPVFLPDRVVGTIESVWLENARQPAHCVLTHACPIASPCRAKCPRLPAQLLRGKAALNVNQGMLNALKGESNSKAGEAEVGTGKCRQHGREAKECSKMVAW